MRRPTHGEIRGEGLMFSYKLGKAPAKKDDRNFRLALLLRKLPPVPEEWNDLNLKLKIPMPMFANDVYGDCVIAARAHQTMRFEANEQKKVIEITDDEVLKEYWKESGGEGPEHDRGLILLNSLKLWRKQGWKAGGQEYKIHAFAEIGSMNPRIVKTAIYLLSGAMVGLMLPLSAQKQLEANWIWENISADSEPSSWGGHCVYLVGYNQLGPVCITWGKTQQMTWGFFQTYCDESYAIVDAKDRFLEDSILNVEKLEYYLDQLEV
jgi:hypothetical protein